MLRFILRRLAFIVGVSLGTVAAIYFAEVFRAPLRSICGAARGEDT
jgi:hypothetical protein